MAAKARKLTQLDLPMGASPGAAPGAVRFPCLRPVFVRSSDVVGNTYNPNHVETEQMRLLELSIAEDGFTMPIVVCPTGSAYQSWTSQPEGFSASKAIRFPLLDVRQVPAGQVVANDYNPNAVASTELDLLRVSIEDNGVTQGIVACHDPALGVYVVVDGFHRYTVLTRQLGCAEIPVVPISRSIEQRMAATWRHNMARGHHDVQLMADLVGALGGAGWSDSQIAEKLGMESEEVHRLKQVLGGEPATLPQDSGSAPLVVVDGFHRWLTLTRRFRCSHIPVVVLDKPLDARMTSTVQHNRARGKHGTARRMVFVRRMRELGMSNAQIARHLGMPADELLRLQVDRAAAEFYSQRAYSRSWIVVDELDEEEPDADDLSGR